MTNNSFCEANGYLVTRGVFDSAEKGAAFPMHKNWVYLPNILDTMMATMIYVSRANAHLTLSGWNSYSTRTSANNN